MLREGVQEYGRVAKMRKMRKMRAVHSGLVVIVAIQPDFGGFEGHSGNIVACHKVRGPNPPGPPSLQGKGGAEVVRETGVDGTCPIG